MLTEGLLVDSAYALQSHVFVHTHIVICGSMEHKFYLRHSSARNIFERTVGNLKSRCRLINNATNLLMLEYISSDHCNVLQ